MSKFARFLLDQSLFKNLLIVYLISQILPLLIIPRLIRNQLDDLDRFSVSINIWEFIREFPDIPATHQNIKTLKVGKENLFFVNELEVPATYSLRKVFPSELSDTEFFILSGLERECNEAKTLFFVANSGKVFLRVGRECVPFNIIYFPFLFGDNELTVKDFVRVLAFNSAFKFGIRTLKVLGVETVIFLGGSVLGLAFFLFFVIIGLISSGLVFVVNIFTTKEPFSNVFTATNFISTITSIFGIFIIDYFGFSLNLNKLLAIIFFSSGLTYFFISQSTGKSDAG